jgi:hypothetical protein
MSKLLFSLIMLLFFLLGILLSPVFYNFFQQKVMSNFSFILPKTVVLIEQEKVKEKEIELTTAELDQIIKDFPDIVNGIITLADVETKIKTDDGKEYLLWPPQPSSVYTYIGIKNKQKVEVQGRILKNNHLEWRLMK